MLKEQEFKKTVVENLIYYRKLNGLTQLQLAEKLNYSDKAISKWERGESLPDLFIISCIANIYGITLNDMITPKKVQPSPKKNSIHSLVTVLSILLVWLVATVVFVFIKLISPELPKVWLSFIFAIPVSMIVWVIFASMWGNYLYKFFTISGLCWSIPVALTIAIHIHKNFSRSLLCELFLEHLGGVD